MFDGNSLFIHEQRTCEAVRACQIFCVNGVSVASGESIAELNSKTRKLPFKP